MSNTMREREKLWKAKSTLTHFKNNKVKEKSICSSSLGRQRGRWAHQHFKYTNVLLFSASCLSFVRSKELHTPRLSLCFSLHLSVCVSLSVCASRLFFFFLFHSQPCLLMPFNTLFHQVSTLKCQLFRLLQFGNETPHGSGADWWLHFPVFLSSPFLREYLFVYHWVCLAIFSAVAPPVYSFGLPPSLLSPLLSFSLSLCGSQLC